MSSQMGEFSMCIYYPGQDLRGPIDALSTAKWLHSTPRYCHKVASRIGKTRDVNCIIEKVDDWVVTYLAELRKSQSHKGL